MELKELDKKLEQKEVSSDYKYFLSRLKTSVCFLVAPCLSVIYYWRLDSLVVL